MLQLLRRRCCAKCFHTHYFVQSHDNPIRQAPLSLSFSSWRILETQRREGACTWTHSSHGPECILSVVRAMDYQQTAGQKHSDTIYTVVYDTGNTPKSSQRPLMPETMQDELPYSSMVASALELVFSFHTGCDEYLHKLKQPCHQRY